LGVFLDSKLYFHNLVDFIFSHCITLLGLVRSVTINFSSFEYFVVLYFTLVRSKVEYASIVSNSVASTDTNKLERIQQNFAALCFNLFFPQFHCSYALDLDQLKFHTQRKRRYHLDALFITLVCRGFKFCSSLLESVGGRVPAPYVGVFYV
jgi:hypothetical protein